MSWSRWPTWPTSSSHIACRTTNQQHYVCCENSLLWYNAVIYAFSSDSDSAFSYSSEDYTMKLWCSHVPKFKNKNIYILHYSGSDPQTLKWVDATEFRDNVHLLELRQRLEIEDTVKVWYKKNRLRWYGYVLRKDGDDWVKNVLLWRLRVVFLTSF